MPHKKPIVNRKIVRGDIFALACHVAHLLECSRCYGANAKKKRVNDVVISVEKRTTKTGWLSNYIHGKYNFGNRTKNTSVL